MGEQISELPWRKFPSGTICSGKAKDLKTVALVRHDTADAAFIVRAVNSHYDLIEALTELARDPRDSSQCVGDGWAYYSDAIAYARAALARTKEAEANHA